MKNRILKLCLFVIAVLALTVSLAACDPDTPATEPSGTSSTPGSSSSTTPSSKPDTYTLTYAVGEGVTGSYAAGTYAKDTVVTLPDGAELTKENHTFGGWTDGTNTYAAGASFTMPASNMTLTAVWTENTYTLTYAAGEGATGSYAAGTYAKDAAVTLPDGAELTKENHTFRCWTDGTNIYEPGAAYTMPAKDVTLTAVWMENTYTLTYAAGEGATGSYPTGTYTKDTAVTLPDGTELTKENHTFGGWTDGTNTYAAGASFTMPASNVTLRAVWTENEAGGDENTDEIHVYTDPTGDDTVISKIAHNVTKATITVTYDYGFGPKEIVFHLTDAADGDWTVDESDTDILGSAFMYVNFAEAGKLKLCNAGCNPYITFTLDTGDGEGGNEGGEGSGDEATDVIKVFTHEGAQINGHTVTRIEYNQTKSKITVTYDGTQTVTYQLSDWGDGDWRINETTIFGSLFCITILPVDNATTCKVDLAGYGAVDVVFTLEGASDGGEGGGETGGEDIDKVYEIVAEGAWAVTQVAGNTINKLVYNAAKATMTVTYNGDQTVTYTLKVGQPIYDIIDAWTIVEADHIFTAAFAGFAIEEDYISLYVGGDVLNFVLAASGEEEGGDDGEQGGTGGGDTSGLPVYTNDAGAAVNGHTITAIEYNQLNGAIMVTYDGGQTATYSIFDYGDGTWGISAYSHIFGGTFSCMEISDTELVLFDHGGNVMATFYIEA